MHSSRQSHSKAFQKEIWIVVLSFAPHPAPFTAFSPYLYLPFFPSHHPLSDSLCLSVCVCVFKGVSPISPLEVFCSSFLFCFFHACFFQVSVKAKKMQFLFLCCPRLHCFLLSSVHRFLVVLFFSFVSLVSGTRARLAMFALVVVGSNEEVHMTV